MELLYLTWGVLHIHSGFPGCVRIYPALKNIFFYLMAVMTIFISVPIFRESTKISSLAPAMLAILKAWNIPAAFPVSF